MKRSDQSNGAFIPIWFKVPASFYRLLEKVSVDSKIKAPDVLTESLKLFAKVHPLAKEAGLPPSEWLRDAARLIRERKRASQAPNKPLVAYRWEKVPPEQRSQLARDLARQRWAKRDREHVERA